MQTGTGNDSMDDTALEEGLETSPTPNRRTRREACTCPYCKDGEGRYVCSALKHTTLLPTAEMGKTKDLMYSISCIDKL